MAIQAAELYDFAVEFETVIGELRFAKADAPGIVIVEFGSAQQANVNGIEMRGSEVPEFNAPQIFERDGVNDRFGGCRRGGKFPSVLANHDFTIVKLHLERERHIGLLEVADVAVHFNLGMRSKDILRLGKDVFDKAGRNNAERDFAIDATEGEVVDLVAERRSVWTLGGIEVRRQLERKWSIAAFVFTKANTIDPYSGCGHDAFKIDKNAAAASFSGQFEFAAINRDKFVGFVIKAVPGQLDVGMRDNDVCERGVVEGFLVSALHEGRIVTPVAIDGENRAPAR